MSMRLFLERFAFLIVVGVVNFIPIFCCACFLWIMVGFMSADFTPAIYSILKDFIIPAGMLAVWIGIMRYIFGSSGEGTTSFFRFSHVIYLWVIGIVLAVPVHYFGFIVDAVLLFVFQQRLSFTTLVRICITAKALVWGYSMCKLFVFTKRDRQA